MNGFTSFRISAALRYMSIPSGKLTTSSQERHTRCPISDLGVLRTSNVHKGSRSGMYNVQQLQDGRSIVYTKSAFADLLCMT